MILVELGPGHGTLMSDMLRVLEKIQAKIDSVHLIEVSPKLQGIQKNNIKSSHPVFFHDHLDSLPQSPAIFVANEFFDAFPVKQFNGDQEIRIGLDERGELKRLSNGDIKEEMSKAIDYFNKILNFLKKNGGVFIIIDYGAYQGQGDTLQALGHHEFQDPFKNPGLYDLTTHIQFGVFEKIAKNQGFKTNFQTQGQFLESMGIMFYAAKLDLLRDAKRLTYDMGDLFKVLIIYS